jgi:GH25 family lysozyme M1 (1,4-beta-N-acetylmuramidase)
MSKKIILDLSHWNQVVDWKKLADNADGVIIKISQGARYRDILAKEHYAGAKSVGLLIGGYHFATNDNAIAQYNNFSSGMDELGKFDFIPSMDCEAFTSFRNELISARELVTYVYPYSKFMSYSTEESLYVRSVDLLEGVEFSNVNIYSLAYPSQDVVDVIGRRLIEKYGKADIYTNVGSGNKIFTKKIIGDRYALWVANWGVEVPMLPAVWKGKKWMLHQKAVVDGTKYGVKGKVDYNEWGELLPFPNDVPVPVNKYFDGIITTNEGIFRGKMVKE